MLVGLVNYGCARGLADNLQLANRNHNCCANKVSTGKENANNSIIYSTTNCSKIEECNIKKFIKCKC